MPCFQAHECTPPSPSPPFGESSFVTCHVSELTNALLPLPPSSSPPGSESSFVTCHVSELTNAFLPLPPSLSVSPLCRAAFPTPLLPLPQASFHFQCAA